MNSYAEKYSSGFNLLDLVGDSIKRKVEFYVKNFAMSSLVAD